MANLTSEEVSALAGNFLVLAQSVGDYRIKNWDTLPAEENKLLGKHQEYILKAGEDMFAQSTTLVMEEVQASLKEIGSVTSKIKETVTSLKNIQKVINIAASAVVLGTAIISKNPKAILAAIKKLKASWESKA